MKEFSEEGLLKVLEQQGFSEKKEAEILYNNLKLTLSECTSKDEVRKAFILCRDIMAPTLDVGTALAALGIL